MFTKCVHAFQTNENGTVITLHGTASTDMYAELFNNVLYFSWLGLLVRVMVNAYQCYHTYACCRESNATESRETVVLFEVTDGVHSNDVRQSSIR